MKFGSVLGFACAAVIGAGTALATPTPQQLCDHARITAWKVYTSCIDTVAAKVAKGVILDTNCRAAFAKCRYAYFKKWTAFQPKASLTGSTCIGSRYSDNGDQTVTDNLSGLTWEKKDDGGGIHDKDNIYIWSSALPFIKENGTAFTTFLSSLNAGGGFGGANGWRLPTMAELQSIMLDFACTGYFGGPNCVCASIPCVDPHLDAANTFTVYYTATTFVPDPTSVWLVNFYDGSILGSLANNKAFGTLVRAVRGGL